MITLGTESECAAGGVQARIPNDVESAKSLISTEGARLCATATKNTAHAVVLTGSMSRGEATLKKGADGWQVLGDATFLVVTDKPLKLATRELECSIQNRLLSQGINCKVVVVMSTTAELRNLRPHIYAYELRERGVVVWGEKTALTLIAPFTVADIPKEDGWWLLCNRMIEQLETAADAGSAQYDGQGVRYRIAKLYLAMAACYLLVIEQYDPSYRERAARLHQLANTQPQPESPLPLRRFSQSVAQCTELKLRGEIPDLSKYPNWHEAVADAECVWRWSLSRILGLDHTISREELIARMAARQPLVARAKGWVRGAYVHPSAFRPNWLRWIRLAPSTSPRYLVYGAASELFFSGASGASLDPAQLADTIARLPLRELESGQELSWHTASKLVARNFHLFLESTRS